MAKISFTQDGSKVFSIDLSKIIDFKSVESLQEGNINSIKIYLSSDNAVDKHVYENLEKTDIIISSNASSISRIYCNFNLRNSVADNRVALLNFFSILPRLYSLKQLELCCNSGDEEIAFIIKQVANNQLINYLKIHGGIFGDKSAIELKKVLNNGNIEYLILNSCLTNKDNISYIVNSSGDCPKLKVLDLSYNIYRDQDLEVYKTMGSLLLQNLLCLKKLNISNSQPSEQGLKIVLDNLENNHFCNEFIFNIHYMSSDTIKKCINLMKKNQFLIIDVRQETTYGGRHELNFAEQIIANKKSIHDMVSSIGENIYNKKSLSKEQCQAFQKIGKDKFIEKFIYLEEKSIRSTDLYAEISDEQINKILLAANDIASEVQEYVKQNYLELKELDIKDTYLSRLPFELLYNNVQEENDLYQPCILKCLGEMSLHHQ